MKYIKKILIAISVVSAIMGWLVFIPLFWIDSRKESVLFKVASWIFFPFLLISLFFGKLGAPKRVFIPERSFVGNGEAETIYVGSSDFHD